MNNIFVLIAYSAIFLCVRLEKPSPSTTWKSGPVTSRKTVKSAGSGRKTTARMTTTPGMGTPPSRCSAVTADLPSSRLPGVMSSI